jgi:hypothetical protein
VGVVVVVTVVAAMAPKLRPATVTAAMAVARMVFMKVS